MPKFFYHAKVFVNWFRSFGDLTRLILQLSLDLDHRSYNSVSVTLLQCNIVAGL